MTPPLVIVRAPVRSKLTSFQTHRREECVDRAVAAIRPGCENPVFHPHAPDVVAKIGKDVPLGRTPV